MSEPPVLRSIASVHLLVALAGERGVSPSACLAGSGLAERQLRDPFAEIEARQELAVVRNLVRRLGDEPGLGIEAGSRYHLTAYGIWGYALLSSPTLGKAMEVGLRYLDLTFAFARFEAEREGDEVRVVLDDRAIPEDCRTFLVERDAAAMVQVHRDLFARPIPLRRVAFRFPAPADTRRHRAAFLGPVSFGAARNEVVIDVDQADRRLPQANAQTARLCELQCGELLARRRARTGLSARVRDALLRPGARADLEATASSLAVSPRTLRRHLAAEGTSFRRLVEEVRETLAEEMLSRRMSVAEVAERLGYAEPASFIHAFKRWKGQPPGHYRQRLERRG